MSTVGAPNNGNPFSHLHTLRRQGHSSGSAAQGDSQQFAVAAPQGASAASAPAAGATTASPSSGGAVSNSGSTTFPSFAPQTLQALLALQTSGG